MLPFIVSARYQIELAAGGNSSFTKGVDYTEILHHSSYLPEVKALYRAAGLNLDSDLATLTRHAGITADPGAIATLAHTSMVTGHLSVPELDIHTIDDQLVPIQQENWYLQRVIRLLIASLPAGIRRRHWALQLPARRYVAALHALEHRLDTGRWGDVTQPAALNAAATATSLGAFDPTSDSARLPS